jgi:hypothetical protein
MGRALVGEGNGSALVEFAPGLAFHEPGDAAFRRLEGVGEAGDLVGEVFGETFEMGEAFLEGGAGFGHGAL